MAKYRDCLPQMNGKMFLTDGGIETTLVFLEGFDLPHFAAFDLLKSDGGRNALRAYFERYVAIARANGTGFVLESATWRANPDWAEKVGYSREALDRANRQAIDLLAEIRNTEQNENFPLVISGCIGPRDDGYNPAAMMSEDEAERYHSEQIGTFAETEADMVTAVTMTYPEEAIGIARAARAKGMPAVISFTVETDGRLPSGHELGEAIQLVDAATDHAPAYYMINCAHPSHFEDVLAEDSGWLERIKGLRANASALSHAELDEAEELDDGNPEELGQQYHVLKHKLKNLSVFGGCCGTDHRHVAAICKACCH